MRLAEGIVRCRCHAGRSRPRVSAAAAAAATPITRSGPKRAIIVGGGIGGLVTAGRLAKEGFSVILLEQNEEVCGIRVPPMGPWGSGP